MGNAGAAGAGRPPHTVTSFTGQGAAGWEETLETWMGQQARTVEGIFAMCKVGEEVLSPPTGAPLGSSIRERQVVLIKGSKSSLKETSRKGKKNVHFPEELPVLEGRSSIIADMYAKKETKMAPLRERIKKIPEADRRDFVHAKKHAKKCKILLRDALDLAQQARELRDEKTLDEARKDFRAAEVRYKMIAKNEFTNELRAEVLGLGQLVRAILKEVKAELAAPPPAAEEEDFITPELEDRAKGGGMEKAAQKVAQLFEPAKEKENNRH